MTEQRIDRLERMFEAFLLNQEKYRAEREIERANDRAEREKERAEREKERAEREKERAEREKERVNDQIKWEKERAESAREMKELKRLWSDLGLTQGEIAEEGIYRSIASTFQKRGKVFEKIARNVVRKENGQKIVEFDILAINGSEILPIEVKNKLTQKDVDYFLEVRLPKLKSAFPEYAEYKVLGGVGGLVVKEEVELYAQKKGLYVFTQHSNGNMELANDKNFVGKVFL